MVSAVLFPGQGSQFVGMGGDLFDVRPDLLGESADRVLGWSLRSMCLEGPEDVLTRTEHAQPALFALSVAMWRVIESEGAGPDAAAGHSLGEYSALVAAGVLDFDQALAVVAERGQAMADAADAEPSGMAALIGADPAMAEEVAARRRSDGGRLFVANDNAPGQVVLAGGLEDLDWLETNVRELGVRRAVRLKVAGAFHSAFMRPAATRVGEALARVEPAVPRFPVYSNVTALPHAPDEIRGLLVDQVISEVRFRETLVNMAGTGIDTFIHVGPGDVTAGMAKRTVEGATVITVNDLGGVPAAVEALNDPPGGG